MVPEDLARGELREETGLTADRMTHLSTLQIAYGVMNQKQHVYLAEGLRMGEADPDAEESDLVVRRVSVEEFEEMVLDGTIVDNCSVAAWGLYRLWRSAGGRFAIVDLRLYFVGEFSSKTMLQVSLSGAARRLQFSRAFLRALSGVICAVENAK